jgi:hypothetical protein
MICRDCLVYEARPDFVPLNFRLIIEAKARGHGRDRVGHAGLVARRLSLTKGRQPFDFFSRERNIGVSTRSRTFLTFCQCQLGQTKWCDTVLSACRLDVSCQLSAPMADTTCPENLV